MAIPSRQIGWSGRANLLWQISKQLEYLTCVATCGCGNTTTTTSTTVAPTTTTTTTGIPQCLLFEIQVGVSGNISGINCDGVPFSASLAGPSTETLCAISVSGTGDITITELGPCEV